MTTEHPEAGSVYIYDLAGANPSSPVFTLHNPEPTGSASFGSCVSISGTHVAVGSERGLYGLGVVYVFDLAGDSPSLPIATLSGPASVSEDAFGCSVSISGRRVAVGAYAHSSGALASGSAYVYDLDSTTPQVPVLSLDNPNPADGDYFGWSVAIAGSRVAVGAYYDDTGASYSGGAYIYDLNSPSPTTPVAVLNNPDPTENDYLGASIAMDGLNVVIGAPGKDTTAWDKGAAYFFSIPPHASDTDGDGLLDSWEIAHFGNITAHSALDDSDGDGLTELMELALGTDPTIPDARQAPSVTNEGGFLTLTLSKRAGVSYTVQSAGSPDANAFSSATTTVLIDDAFTLKVRDNIPVGSAGSRFLRVKVDAAP